MRAELIYQRWIEGLSDLPPQWTWPVLLSDNRVILTLLYRKLSVSEPGILRTEILELDAKGNSKTWPPGLGYPAPVIFYANDRDELLGLDLIKKGKVYACLPDGTHRWTLETTIRMDCLIAPRSFHQVEDQLHWVREDGKPAAADVSSGQPVALLVEKGGQWSDGEVRFPYTHVTKGNLFVLDFDPMPRISRYQLK